MNTRLHAVSRAYEGNHMIIRQVESDRSVAPTQIKVTAKCGETRYVLIAGTSVEFTCASGHGQPEVIPSPSSLGPGRVAIINMDDLLARLPAPPEINAYADPVAIAVPQGRNVSIEDIDDAIAVARQENRAIRFDLGSDRD